TRRAARARLRARRHRADALDTRGLRESRITHTPHAAPDAPAVLSQRADVLRDDGADLLDRSDAHAALPSRSRRLQCESGPRRCGRAGATRRRRTPARRRPPQTPTASPPPPPRRPRPRLRRGRRAYPRRRKRESPRRFPFIARHHAPRLVTHRHRPLFLRATNFHRYHLAYQLRARLLDVHQTRGAGFRDFIERVGPKAGRYSVGAERLDDPVHHRGDFSVVERRLRDTWHFDQVLPASRHAEKIRG